MDFLVLASLLSSHLFVLLVTFSVPGAKSGLNLRSFSNGISSFSTIESPFTGPYFVTLSTGGLTTSPVSGFLIPGLPGTSSFCW